MTTFIALSAIASGSALIGFVIFRGPIPSVMFCLVTVGAWTLS